MGLKWNYTHPGEIYTEMASLMPALANISWDRLAREDAVTYPSDAPDQPGHDVVFEKGFPRPGGFGRLVAAKIKPPITHRPRPKSAVRICRRSKALPGGRLGIRGCWLACGFMLIAGGLARLER
jgi:predicted molibdopterin-dependent oxidoreductase YjgC